VNNLGNPSVLLAHPGTQYAHQLARQLERHKTLGEFWTGFALAEDSSFTKHFDRLPASWTKRISNRILAGVPPYRLRTMPWIEWKSQRQLHRGIPAQEVYHRRNRDFQRKIPEASIENSSALIGFDTSSWILAERAQSMSKPFFLDQSASHPLVSERILGEVPVTFPEWQQFIDKRIEKVLACENLEYQLATKIVVASSFSKNTLISQGVNSSKIVVNPYGVDLNLFRPPDAPRDRKTIRFLFLGAISAHKGVPLLLRAWKHLDLGNAELWLVGAIGNRERRLIPDLPNLRVIGKRAHAELPNLLQQCDVLVFPSYCEGFGLVLLEALASGLPVITTETTAGPDLIRNGAEGYLIPAGDLSSLCDTMSLCLDEDRLKSMSIAARARAEAFSWDSYGDRWQKILRDC
jgi:glycosyltransferase involved in cell wall biosynthesis